MNKEDLKNISRSSCNKHFFKIISTMFKILSISPTSEHNGLAPQWLFLWNNMVSRNTVEGHSTNSYVQLLSKRQSFYLPVTTSWFLHVKYEPIYGKEQTQRMFLISSPETDVSFECWLSSRAIQCPRSPSPALTAQQTSVKPMIVTCMSFVNLKSMQMEIVCPLVIRQYAW